MTARTRGQKQATMAPQPAAWPTLLLLQHFSSTMNRPHRRAAAPVRTRLVASADAGARRSPADIADNRAPAAAPSSATVAAMAASPAKLNGNRRRTASYLIFHETAHDTEAGKAENANGTQDANHAHPDKEKLANTIADALEQYMGLNPLFTARYGYDSTNPGFSVPTPPPKQSAAEWGRANPLTFSQDASFRMAMLGYGRRA